MAKPISVARRACGTSQAVRPPVLHGPHEVGDHARAGGPALGLGRQGDRLLGFVRVDAGGLGVRVHGDPPALAGDLEGETPRPVAGDVCVDAARPGRSARGRADR